MSAGDPPEARAGDRRTVGFSYAVIRAVPRVERGEFVNIGVIIYCQDRDYLNAAIAIDDVRLRALDHQIDLDTVAQAAESITRRCLEPVGSAAGERRAALPLRHPDRTAEHGRPDLTGARRDHRRSGADSDRTDGSTGRSARVIKAIRRNGAVSVGTNCRRWMIINTSAITA